MVVRGAYYPKGDTTDTVPTPSRHRATFRYSIKMEAHDEAEWRYSLDVGGVDHPYDELVTIGDVEFYGILPITQPTWVVSKTWGIATFVDTIRGYHGSEGVYAYSANSVDYSLWLVGKEETFPTYFEHPYLEAGHTITLTKKSNNSLPEKFRGEYSSSYFHQPYMSFSPIDYKMHLWYAEGGTWNLEPGLMLRMHNLNGDPYIDGWTRETVKMQQPTLEEIKLVAEDNPWWPRAYGDEILEVLYALNGHFIYSGEEGSELRRADYPLSLFETYPPVDKETWQEFREKLEPYYKTEGDHYDLHDDERSPYDLYEWMEAFDDYDVLMRSTGPLSETRLTPDGFRFIVNIQPGYYLDPAVKNGQNLAPGKYVMSYDGESFTIDPFTPPQPYVGMMREPLQEHIQTRMHAILHNSGAGDLLGMTLTITATSPEGKGHRITEQEVEFLGNQVITKTFSWAPDVSGTWTFEPCIAYPKKKTPPVCFGKVEMQAVPAPPSGTAALINISTIPEAVPFIGVSLVAFALMAGLIMWKQ